MRDPIRLAGTLWPGMLLLMAAGCATNASHPVYARHEAHRAWQVHDGEVIAVDEARIEGRHTPLGTIGGGLIGHSVGRTIGGGSGRRVAGAVGAVAGAVAGRAVERAATGEPAWQITVDLEDGRTIAVVQARDADFTVGERVRVYLRRGGAARVAKT